MLRLVRALAPLVAVSSQLFTLVTSRMKAASLHEEVLEAHLLLPLSQQKI